MINYLHAKLSLIKKNIWNVAESGGKAAKLPCYYFEVWEIFCINQFENSTR